MLFELATKRSNRNQNKKSLSKARKEFKSKISVSAFVEQKCQMPRSIVP